MGAGESGDGGEVRLTDVLRRTDLRCRFDCCVEHVKGGFVSEHEAL